MWYPEKACGRPPAGKTADDNHGRDAKAICAECPVAVDCLQDALARREKLGIRGGASPRRRRVLLVAWLQRRHDYSPSCTSTACEWCPLVREHLGGLSGHAESPFDLNGPNAQHGRRSTYARGCRCGTCTFAASTIGVRFDYAGWDVPEWWEETFAGNRDDALVDVAKMFAEQLLGIAA